VLFVILRTSVPLCENKKSRNVFNKSPQRKGIVLKHSLALRAFIKNIPVDAKDKLIGKSCLVCVD
jgi:hypothetical protein